MKNLIGNIKTEEYGYNQPLSNARSLEFKLKEEKTLNREDVAVQMMQAVIIKNDVEYPMSPKECADLAVQYAEAIMETLNEKIEASQKM